LAQLDTLSGVLAGLANEMGVLEELITPILSECTPDRFEGVAGHFDKPESAGQV
jgi:hypothetical protein